MSITINTLFQFKLKKYIKQRLFELNHFNISGVILDISFVTLSF